ncbi:MAG: fatty acid desaturase [Hyphomicrobiaceae bacterium]
MTAIPATATAAKAVRDWRRLLQPYRSPRLARSVFELAVTLVPFVLLWSAAFLALEVGYWLTLLLVVPAAMFLVRLFLIQHDCGHNAFFRSRAVNDWLGRTLGVLTMTPYGVWKHSHAMHHATAGNLDQRGIGDIKTLTVAEYRALSPLMRLKYRLYRHPVIMFALGPTALFLLLHRVPLGQMRRGWRPWASAMGTNVAIAAVATGMMTLTGIQAFLLVHLPIVAVAASMGVWLFYVQHQFEETHWSAPPQWSHDEAALHGSSHYDLPGGLKWLTAYIGVHHVHHLASRIPFYRLPEVLRDFPELLDVRRITVAESLACVRLKLWDTERQRLVTFVEAQV